MKTKALIPASLRLGVIVLFLLGGTTLRAQPPSPNEYDYRGTILAVNMAAKTFVVGKEKVKITLHFSSQTYVYLNDREASEKDIRVGAEALGIARLENGRIIAENLFMTDRRPKKSAR